MPKLEKRRVLIQDNRGKVFRPLSFSFGYDKYGEAFLKIMLPDFKTESLGYRKFIKAEDGPSHITTAQSLANGMWELTYHFAGGVRHPKGKQPLLQERNLPILQPQSLLHVLALSINDLAWMQPIKAHRINPDDISLPPFDKRPRRLALYLIKDIREMTINFMEQGTELAGTHVTKPNKEGVSLVILDTYVNNAKNMKGVSIFYYDDPTAPSRKPKDNDSLADYGLI